MDLLAISVLLGIGLIAAVAILLSIKPGKKAPRYFSDVTIDVDSSAPEFCDFCEGPIGTYGDVVKARGFYRCESCGKRGRKVGIWNTV